MGSLARFRTAQDHGGVYERALSELRSGAKRSHWMWFVFPQLAGLGSSEMSRTYALSSLQEARAHIADPVLGERLRACAGALLEHDELSAEQLLGGIDARKLRSSMTLFARACVGEPLFGRVLDRYFDGAADPATDALLGSLAGSRGR